MSTRKLKTFSFWVVKRDERLPVKSNLRAVSRQAVYEFYIEHRPHVNIISEVKEV